MGTASVGAHSGLAAAQAVEAGRRKEYAPAEVEAYRAKVEATGIGPAFIHGVYLVNLATGNPENLAKSVDALIHDMKVCHLLGATGVIFHIGSHRGAGYDQVLRQVRGAVGNVVGATP